MSLVTRAVAVASHAFFFREDDAFVSGTDQDGNPVGAGIAGQYFLPDPLDAGWIDVDIVEDWEDTITDEKKTPVWRAVPGSLIKDDEITTLQGIDFKMTCAKFTPFAAEAFYRTTAKLDNDSYQFDPLTGPPRKGWLMFQRYNHRNEAVLAGNIFTVCRVTGGMKGGNKGELVMPTFELTLLYSPLNTMGLGTP